MRTERHLDSIRVVYYRDNCNERIALELESNKWGVSAPLSSIRMKCVGSIGYTNRKGSIKKEDPTCTWTAFGWSGIMALTLDPNWSFDARAERHLRTCTFTGWYLEPLLQSMKTGQKISA
jgi:hypothetical protein